MQWNFIQQFRRGDSLSPPSTTATFFFEYPQKLFLRTEQDWRLWVEGLFVGFFCFFHFRNQTLIEKPCPIQVMLASCFRSD